MKCPRDQTELSIKNKEGVVGYCCNDCSGIFLKGIGMKAFKLNFETDILESSFENPLNNASDIHCANCSSQMQVSLIDEVEIDICHHCQGVWFDKREVTKILDENSPVYELKDPSLIESIFNFIYILPLIGSVYLLYEYIFN
jgi:Zn-finger nucleic acid-binding protein